MLQVVGVVFVCDLGEKQEFCDLQELVELGFYAVQLIWVGGQ